MTANVVRRWWLINGVFSVIYSNLWQLSHTSRRSPGLDSYRLYIQHISLTYIPTVCMYTYQKNRLPWSPSPNYLLFVICSTQGLYNPYLLNMRRLLPYPYRCWFTIVGRAIYRSSYIMYVWYNYLSQHWRVKMQTLAARTAFKTYLFQAYLASTNYKHISRRISTLSLCTQGFFCSGFCPFWKSGRGVSKWQCVEICVLITMCEG